MQHETHTHGINMSALGRDKQSLNLAQETVPDVLAPRLFLSVLNTDVSESLAALIEEALMLPELCVLPRSWSKNTPGERCSCETMTLSVPLMMKVLPVCFSAYRLRSLTQT